LPSRLKSDDDLIVVFAPGLKKDAIAITMRHEAAHHLDENTFVKKFSAQIEPHFTSDRHHIDQLQACINAIHDTSDVSEIQKMDQLFNLYSDQENLPIMERRRKLMKAIEHVQKRVETYMPRDSAKPHFLYPTKEKQLNEIPAVLDELSAYYGNSFMKELLPSMYRLTRQHKLNNAALHNER
jgi:hypothetical protein